MKKTVFLSLIGFFLLSLSISSEQCQTGDKKGYPPHRPIIINPGLPPIAVPPVNAPKPTRMALNSSNGVFESNY